jgi:N-carbamoyl-L-amino-acid hydrolase
MMDISAIRVEEGRLRKEIEDLGKFGETPGDGMMRTALSDADLEARRWLKSRMEEAGLRVLEDAAANIIGRVDPTSGPADGPCIATGSHIDAVLYGGKFDGALGICASLEALRAIRESGLPIPRPLELLVFTDEEGGHYAGTFGSRAMFNLLATGEIFKSKGVGRPSLAQSLQRMGKDPEQISQAVRSPSDFQAFLELHIEQGPVLDSLDIPIGIVEGIVSIDRYLLHVTGKAGHAGTTPLNLRDDALVKAARLITALNEVFRSAEPGLVGTIGELRVYPGAFNIIPGKVEMSLDLRSMKKIPLQSVRKQVREIAHSMGNVRIETLLSKGGVTMNPGIMKSIERSCRERGVRWKRMGSGAGHDAMTFPTQGIPTGMIFVPCIGGKSHCPEEAIRWQDAALGAQILADTMMRITHGAGGKMQGRKVKRLEEKKRE